jgi:hypothetical protein
VMVVDPTFPARSVPDFISYAKPIFYSWRGSTWHK